MPSTKFKDAFIAMMLDYQRNGEGKYQIENIEVNDAFEKYIARIQERARGLNLKPGFVQENTFWLMENSTIYGASRLRHSLTEKLLMEGGHIGYDVPPSCRRLGYGTLLLKLTLEEAKTIGLERVLLTCDSDNIGSRKTILKNGGILENEIEYEGRLKCRYWITI
ncbi:MAG: GNAT family N-acetyltransferase [Anaerolineales bacterium]|nr:GNAT family N-acetyltransferase [Anaerolineales bacterium]NUQ83326.1 GNAT family N-acetyltransferase [Anaerolineales bacterium]